MSHGIILLCGNYLGVKSTSGLKQHLVIVREDRKVICYDHKLERKWKVMLPHDGSPGEGGSFVIDQVCMRHL